MKYIKKLSKNDKILLTNTSFHAIIPAWKEVFFVNWNKDKSIVLSMVCVIVFAAALLAVDLESVLMIGRPEGLYLWRGSSVSVRIPAADLIEILLCSLFAWPALLFLWRLLDNLRKGVVFSTRNVSLMRRVSWCCAGVAIVSLVCAFRDWPLIIVAAAAAFMMLIVRIVKNVFQQAAAMKDELDLTV